MSKSNKKQSERLKDSCRQNKRRSERHHVKELLRDGRYEQAEDLAELPDDEESSEQGEIGV